MADEQYQWLNRETAERLLRGEPLENVDDAARGQAGRLAGALFALSAEAVPAKGELLGEEGALAAFRKARETASEPAVVLGRGGLRTRRSGVSDQPSDAGLVRIGSGPRRAFGRPRWARPVRLALAAAVAVGTVGGVAMAAGTGILPMPFGKGDPGPAASVSVGATPDRSVPSPLVSPSGDAGRDASSGPPAPSAPPSRVAPTGSGLRTPGPNPAGSGSASGWGGAPAACRDLQDGKTLGSGRERQLETAAGGAARVPAYCKVVLANTDGAADGVSTKSDQGNNGQGNSDQGGNNGQGDQGNQGDQGQGDQGLSGGDDGNGANAGHGTQRRGGGAPLPSTSPSAPTDSPTPSPSPSSSPSASSSPSSSS